MPEAVSLISMARVDPRECYQQLAGVLCHINQEFIIYVTISVKAGIYTNDIKPALTVVHTAQQFKLTFYFGEICRTHNKMAELYGSLSSNSVLKKDSEYYSCADKLILN